MSAALVVYNTRTRRKERFEAIEAGKAGIYSCGPTVYAPQHIANLRPYVFADTLRRTLLELGYAVHHVTNITDVGHLTDDADAGEDKMEVAAQRAGKRAEDIAQLYTDEWLRDRRSLNCLDADVLCKATEHIPEQIALGQALEARGFLYSTADGVYFDTAKFARYPDFAKLDLEGQEGGARIGEVADKRNPADFAIWKFADPAVRRQQEWDSPWGRGFPGWHLECSAMSSKYLGTHFDIHTGGIDHVSVHHTNEIAQSECGFDVEPWVNYWMHNAFIDFAGDKMSKSKGNVALLQELVDGGLDPLAYRYFLLQAIYRQPLSFTQDALDGAATGYRRLRAQAAEVVEAAGEGDASVQAPYRERLLEALCDDLNTPKAVAVVWEVARSKDLSAADKRDLFAHFDDLLALDLSAPLVAEDPAGESDPRIDALVEARTAARASKDFGEADRIRDVLAAEGITITDTPDGVRWSRN